MILSGTDGLKNEHSCDFGSFLSRVQTLHSLCHGELREESEGKGLGSGVVEFSKVGGVVDVC